MPTHATTEAKQTGLPSLMAWLLQTVFPCIRRGLCSTPLQGGMARIYYMILGTPSMYIGLNLSVGTGGPIVPPCLHLCTEQKNKQMEVVQQWWCSQPVWNVLTWYKNC